MSALELQGTVSRRLEEVVRDRLGTEPVVALHGPRTVGKSTLLERIAGTSGGRRVDLDDPTTRSAAAADPLLFVQGEPPVCIDEYQHVPSILDAIKAELSRSLAPGRFVLTGSTTYGSLPLTAQSLTGRLHRLDVWPLSHGEVMGVREAFVERLLVDPLDLVTRTTSGTTREEYAQRVTAGGMPVALSRPDVTARNRWFDDYVSLVVERDVMELSRVRQRAALPRLLREYAARTAQVLVVSAAAGRIELEKSTGENYTRLLEAAYLIHRLPAWGSTLRSRLVTSPKVHVVDTGLGARLLRLTPAKLAQRQPAALTEFGHLVETFAVNECLKQASWLPEPVATGHFRSRDGAEVDLVLERDDGGVVGVEVKASGGPPRASDWTGLRTLRETVGRAFVGGVLLYLGEIPYRTPDGFAVLPLDHLWTVGDA